MSIQGHARHRLATQLGRVGIWTRQLDSQSADVAERWAVELEALGYRSLWIPEALEREVISHATMLLAATSKLVIGTGVAIVPARDARAAALAQSLLCERFPERFVLGVGVSHPAVVERLHRGTGHYGAPLRVMTDYLERVDRVLDAPHPAPPQHRPPRVLAALGPRMTELGRDHADGVHTYLAPVEHTAWARGVLGPARALIVCVRAVCEPDRAAAMAIARESLYHPTRNPAYRRNLSRFGFTDDDFDPRASDRLVNALVACGDASTVAARVRQHLAAGADHVCVEFLTGDDVTVPVQAWRSLSSEFMG